MATQVEPLLPGNPLATAEEHGTVIHGEPEEGEGGRVDGAKRQSGVAEKGSSGGGGGPVQGGTPGAEEQSSTPAAEESRGGCDSEEPPNEEGVKTGGSRKEFTEAPPPKVNPWTRKMNAVTVVSVNGQAHHGWYLLVFVFSLSRLCVGVCPTGGGGVTRGGPSGCHRGQLADIEPQEPCLWSPSGGSVLPAGWIYLESQTSTLPPPGESYSWSSGWQSGPMGGPTAQWITPIKS